MVFGKLFTMIELEASSRRYVHVYIVKEVITCIRSLKSEVCEVCLPFCQGSEAAF
jgi:hypothetical protein